MAQQPHLLADGLSESLGDVHFLLLTQYLKSALQLGTYNLCWLTEAVRRLLVKICNLFKQHISCFQLLLPLLQLLLSKFQIGQLSCSLCKLDFNCL